MSLPLDFTPHKVTLQLNISGSVLRGRIIKGSKKSLAVACEASGVDYKSDSFSDIITDLANIRALVDSEVVTVVPEKHLRPVWKLLTHTPMTGTTASVTCSPTKDLLLSWVDEDGSSHEFIVSADIGNVLMTTQIPFSASARAWDSISDGSVIPEVIAHAAVNIDRYIDIHTTIPQAAESAPIRGLFRQSETVLGCATAFAADISTCTGFLWTGPPPESPTAPTYTPPKVDIHSERWVDIAALSGNLSVHGAAVAVATPGAGHRFTALTTIAVLEATPAVVMCAPTRLWVWTRHAQRLGMTWSVGLGDVNSDLMLVPYHHFTGHHNVPDNVSAVILDALDEYIHQGGELSVLARLNQVIDVPRLAVCEQFPDTLNDQLTILSGLRPGEFEPNTDVMSRYCGNATSNAKEHIGLYLVQMNSSPHRPMRGSDKVRVVDLGDDISQTLDNEEDLASERTPQRQSTIERNIVDVGSPRSLSPKLVAAAELARERINLGESVVVVVRNQRARLVMKSLTLSGGTNSAVDVRIETEWLDFTDVDTVIGVSWPDSFAHIDNSLRRDGSQNVIMVTSDHPVDIDSLVRAATQT